MHIVIQGMRTVTDLRVLELVSGLDITDIRAMDIVAVMVMDTVAATMAAIGAATPVDTMAVMPDTQVADLWVMPVGLAARVAGAADGKWSEKSLHCLSDDSKCC
jgi:hypothetical protein